MTDPVFKNRLNQSHVLEDGRILWESRSCAVMAVVEAVSYTKKETYVALGRRGPGVPDEQGKLCLPCGYIDWDENAFDAIRREVWEELGLDVQDEHEWDYEPQPWWVQSEPNASRQNITMRFWFRRFCEELPELSADNCEPGEVEELIWVPYKEAINMELAFNHQEVIRLYYKDRIGDSTDDVHTMGE